MNSRDCFVCISMKVTCKDTVVILSEVEGFIMKLWFDSAHHDKNKLFYIFIILFDYLKKQSF